MRHLRRVSSASLNSRGMFLTVLATLFVLSACTLPHVKIERKKGSPSLFAPEIASLASSPDKEKKKDKRYLASVSIRFSEAKDATAINFDIRRDKRSFIMAKLWESEETITTMNLGYTRSDGPIVGFKFNWRF